MPAPYVGKFVSGLPEDTLEELRQASRDGKDISQQIRAIMREANDAIENPILRLTEQNLTTRTAAIADYFTNANKAATLYIVDKPPTAEEITKAANNSTCYFYVKNTTNPMQSQLFHQDFLPTSGPQVEVMKFATNTSGKGRVDQSAINFNKILDQIETKDASQLPLSASHVTELFGKGNTTKPAPDKTLTDGVKGIKAAKANNLAIRKETTRIEKNQEYAARSAAKTAEPELTSLDFISQKKQEAQATVAANVTAKAATKVTTKVALTTEKTPRMGR